MQMNMPVSARARKSRMKKSTPSTISSHTVLHNYHDYAHILPRSNDQNKGHRGGVTVPFPAKLHVMLSKVEENGLSHIVSWQPHGRCFVVHKPKLFVTEVMPFYFNQSKLTSFQRQLNLYGFSRITAGKDRGGYYHELFLRHRLFLCQTMSRMRIKGTGIKAKANPEQEPDFYSMSEVNPDDASAELNSDLKDEVITSLQDGCKRSEHVKQPSTKRCQDDGSKKRSSKKRKVSAKKKSFKKEEDNGYSSPGNMCNEIQPAVVVSPNITPRKPPLRASIDFGIDPSVYNKHHGQSFLFNDICGPPLVSSSSSESYGVPHYEPHSGDEVAFEGQHFHYIDSFADQQPQPSIALQPKSSVQRTTLYNRVLSESSQSIAQSLYEPILTPSSSSSSFDDMLSKCMEINPNAIFSDSSSDGGGGSSGEESLEEVDFDAEFALLAASV